MQFVDGSNVLTQLGRKLMKDIRPEKPADVDLKTACSLVERACQGLASTNFVIIRRYWFGSYSGDDEYHDHIADLLRGRHFEPVLIKRRYPNKEKGVDIELTKEMLVNAFHKNYDVGYLVAGDEDYLSLVAAAKRYGPIIYGAFFHQGLSSSLRRSFDRFQLFDDLPKFDEITRSLREAAAP